MRKFTLAFLAVLALSACANISTGYKFEPGSEDGLIIGTITYDSSIGLYTMIVTPPPAATPPKIDVGYSMWPPLGPLFDETISARGSTFAVPARAGQYSIRAWHIKQGYKVSTSTARIDIPFTVEKGKASYIGNLHFSEDWEVSLRDRSARDLPALKAKYEVLRTAPIAYTITSGTDLKGLGGKYESRMGMPIFIPIAR